MLSVDDWIKNVFMSSLLYQKFRVEFLTEITKITDFGIV